MKTINNILIIFNYFSVLWVLALYGIFFYAYLFLGYKPEPDAPNPVAVISTNMHYVFTVIIVLSLLITFILAFLYIMFFVLKHTKRIEKFWTPSIIFFFISIGMFIIQRFLDPFNIFAWWVE
jgi:hypothetical protein